MLHISRKLFWLLWSSMNFYNLFEILKHSIDIYNFLWMSLVLYILPWSSMNPQLFIDAYNIIVLSTAFYKLPLTWIAFNELIKPSQNLFMYIIDFFNLSWNSTMFYNHVGKSFISCYILYIPLHTYIDLYSFLELLPTSTTFYELFDLSQTFMNFNYP